MNKVWEPDAEDIANYEYEIARKKGYDAAFAIIYDFDDNPTIVCIVFQPDTEPA